jgi:hypothetical protein
MQLFGMWMIEIITPEPVVETHSIHYQRVAIPLAHGVSKPRWYYIFWMSHGAARHKFNFFWFLLETDFVGKKRCNAAILFRRGPGVCTFFVVWSQVSTYRLACIVERMPTVSDPLF